MPCRPRPPRVPVDRRPRPRRRPGHRGPGGRGRRARRPGHLLLRRGPDLARLLPLHAGPQHPGGRRGRPVAGGRPPPLDAAGPGRARGRGTGWTAARWPSGGPPTTATAACAHRPSTTGASGWTGERAGWSSRTASTAAPTTAAWPSTWAPTSPAPSKAVRPVLQWRDDHGRQGATLTLPDELAWRRLEGQTDPPAGWYSPSFGVRVPTVTLLGSGRVGHGRALTTVLQLDPGTTP